MVAYILDIYMASCVIFGSAGHATKRGVAWDSSSAQPAAAAVCTCTVSASVCATPAFVASATMTIAA